MAATFFHLAIAASRPELVRPREQVNRQNAGLLTIPLTRVDRWCFDSQDRLQFVERWGRHLFDGLNTTTDERGTRSSGRWIRRQGSSR